MSVILRRWEEEEHRLHTCRDLVEGKEGRRKVGAKEGRREEEGRKVSMLHSVAAIVPG